MGREAVAAEADLAKEMGIEMYLNETPEQDFRRQTKLLSLWWDAVIEEDAATRIQAAYRGRMLRARSLLGVAALLSVGGDRERNAGATAAENDHAAEHSSRASSSAASSSGISASSSVWEDLIVAHAATVIQAWFRGWRWRKRAGGMTELVGNIVDDGSRF